MWGCACGCVRAIMSAPGGNMLTFQEMFDNEKDCRSDRDTEKPSWTRPWQEHSWSADDPKEKAQHAHQDTAKVKICLGILISLGGESHRCFHGAPEWTVWMDVSVQVGIRPLIKWPSAAQEASFLCNTFLLRGTFAEVDIILLTGGKHVWTFRFGASRVKGWFSVLYYKGAGFSHCCRPSAGHAQSQ